MVAQMILLVGSGNYASPFAFRANKDVNTLLFIPHRREFIIVIFPVPQGRQGRVNSKTCLAEVE